MIEVIFLVLFGPSAPFIGHAERILLVTAVLALTALVLFIFPPSTYKPRVRFLLPFTALAWGLFGRNELYAQQQEWNIRVDLLFLWPVVLIVSLVTLGLAIQDVVAYRRLKQQPSKPAQLPDQI